MDIPITLFQQVYSLEKEYLECGPAIPALQLYWDSPEDGLVRLVDMEPSQLNAMYHFQLLNGNRFLAMIFCWVEYHITGADAGNESLQYYLDQYLAGPLDKQFIIKTNNNYHYE